MLVAVSSEAVHQSRPTSKPYIQMIDFFLNNVKQKKIEIKLQNTAFKKWKHDPC